MAKVGKPASRQLVSDSAKIASEIAKLSDSRKLEKAERLLKLVELSSLAHAWVSAGNNGHQIRELIKDSALFAIRTKTEGGGSVTTGFFPNPVVREFVAYSLGGVNITVDNVDRIWDDSVRAVQRDLPNFAPVISASGPSRKPSSNPRVADARKNCDAILEVGYRKCAEETAGDSSRLASCTKPFNEEFDRCRAGR